MSGEMASLLDVWSQVPEDIQTAVSRKSDALERIMG